MNRSGLFNVLVFDLIVNDSKMFLETQDELNRN